MSFSLWYWGYAWSLPPLDARVAEVRWAALDAFSSRDDGTGWRPPPRERLKTMRVEPAVDDECCQVGRILPIIARSSTIDRLARIDDGAMEAIGRSIAERSPFASGEPGYSAALNLQGLVATGSLGDEPVAFAVFVGGEVSNDHHAMDEVLIRLGPRSEVLSARRTWGDVAGIEGFGAGVVSTLIFVVLCGVLPFVLIGASVVRALLRHWRA